MTTLIPARSIERLYVGAAIICLSGALFLIFFENTRYAADAAANSFAQVLSLPAILYAMFAIATRPSASFRAVKRTALPVLLCVMCFASAAWSIDVSATIRRSIILTGLTLFAYSLAIRFSTKELSELFCRSFIFIFALTFIGIAVAPHIAIHQDHHYPAVRGFFAQKNISGRVFLLGLLFGLVLAWHERGRRLLGITTVICCLTAMIASLSATAMVDLAAVLVVFVSALIWRKLDKPSAILATLGSAILIFLVAYLLYDHLFFELIEATGRDVTLTGRTLIWEELYYQVSRRSPVLGFGYEAFWTADAGGTSSIRWVGLGPYTPPQAHNGLIHAYTGMGVFGASAFIYVVLVLAKRGLVAIRKSGNLLLGTLAITFWSYFFFVNFAENEFLTYNSLIWVVFVAVLVQLDKDSTNGGYSS